MDLQRILETQDDFIVTVLNLFRVRKNLFSILFLSCAISLSQHLEEQIYTAAITFINDQNETSLRLLDQQERTFEKKVVSKDEYLALVYLQCNKAYYLKEHSAIKNAIATYEKAWDHFSKRELSGISDFDIIDGCLKPLGNLYTKIGDYTNAENIINQYIYIAKKNGSTIHQIGGSINLAILYQSIGKHRTALQIVDETLRLPGLPPDKKSTLQQIGTSSSMVLGEYQRQQTPNVIPESQATLVDHYKNGYLMAFNQGDLDKAYGFLLKTKEAMLQQKTISARAMAKYYVEEAHLLKKMARSKDALTTLLRALQTLLPNFDGNGFPKRESLYPENTFIDIFDLYGDIQPTANLALESYDLGFYVSEMLQRNITSQESKLLNRAKDRNRSEKCIGLLYKEHVKDGGQKSAMTAFKYAEGSKTTILKEMFSKKSLFQQFPTDSLLRKEQTLLRRQEKLTDLLIKGQLGNSPPNEINSLREALNGVSMEIKAIKKDISEAYPMYNPHTLSIDSIQNKLMADRATLVEYFYGTEAIYQFMVTEKEFFFKKIDITESHQKKLAEFISFFDTPSTINNNIDAYKKTALTIYNWLHFAEVISQTTNVIIVPDGLLSFVPFEALLTHDPQTLLFSEMPFIVLSNTIVYNSSAEFYVKDEIPHKNDNLLGVFPLFRGTPMQLTFSLEEATAVEREMQSTLLLDSMGTKSNFIKNAPKYDILHLSTHANGGTFTVPPTIMFHDAEMSLNEIYSLQITPSLVVLSACETGIGKLQKGEGVMSIARGFQYAGAQNVLFSLWSINDLSTSKIMQSFYRHYRKSQSAPMANRQSKVEYLRDKSVANAKKSPYYWGAFAFHGNISPEQSPSTTYQWVLAFLILVVPLVLVGWFLKKRSHTRELG
ncbi:MAG: CHAT domain-containing protein [Flavobacteriaceae bacterium]